jgi:hypothetical protein
MPLTRNVLIFRIKSTLKRLRLHQAGRLCTEGHVRADVQKRKDREM